MSTKQTILAVEGMTCGSCVRHVEGALRAVDGVTGVKVDLASGKAVVDHGEAPPLETMIAAVVEEGYTARAAP
jgi:copper chaperone CopZ